MTFSELENEYQKQNTKLLIIEELNSKLAKTTESAARRIKQLVIVVIAVIVIAIIFSLSAITIFMRRQDATLQAIDNTQQKITSVLASDSIAAKQFDTLAQTAKYAVKRIDAHDQQLVQLNQSNNNVKIKYEKVRSNYRNLSSTQQFELFSKWLSEADTVGR